MTGPGLSLDHVGAMITDLDAGADQWRRLGFQLAPRSPQIGAIRPGGPMEPWATANHCAVMRRGYLELIGIVDAARFNPWQGYMDRFEGIHIAAFRCDDADAAYGELQDRADGFDAPVDRRREAPFGNGTRTMKFRNIFSQDEFYPEGRFIVIEHQTPEILWRNALMVHPNGAIGLEAMVLVADDDGATRDRMQAVAGVAAIDDRIGLPGGGIIDILDPARFAARFPGVTPPRLPWIGGCVVSVEDLAAARRLIAGNGVKLNDSAGRLWIAPEFANGGVLELVQG
jgi:hypothetical protein